MYVLFIVFDYRKVCDSNSKETFWHDFFIYAYFFQPICFTLFSENMFGYGKQTDPSAFFLQVSKPIC